MANKVGRPRTNSSFIASAKEYRTIRNSLDSPIVQEKKRKNEQEEPYFEQFDKYKADPAAYIAEILNIRLWKKQKDVCDAIIKYGQVCVRSSHLVGKSYLLGGLINWAYDSYNPLGGIISAPTKTLLTDVAFGNARAMRRTRMDWRGEAAPRIESSPDHYVTGLTAKDPTAMQGRHHPNTFLAIDEAVGVTPEIFEAIESLYEGNFKAWVNFYNPTDVSSAVASFEKQPDWKVITISALEHPNIAAGVEILKRGLKGVSVPIPGAITLDRFEQLLVNWSEEIDVSVYDEDKDIILPSTSFTDDIRYFRPGPIAQSRLLARWPESAFSNVFSDSIVNKGKLPIKQEENPLLCFGVDVARFGDDFSAIAVKYGNTIIDIFEVNGYSNTELAGKVIEMIKHYSDVYEHPELSIPIGIDSIGTGSGVVDILYDAGYNISEINVSSRAGNPDKYANTRAEMWFETRDMMKRGEISFSPLAESVSDSLCKQLLAVEYKYNAKGHYLLVPKEQTKKITKRSPDTADAVLLAVYTGSDFANNMTVS